MDTGEEEDELEQRVLVARERRARQSRVRVPSGVLLTLVAVVSILSSFAGGYIMYLDGVKAIEDTVDDLSKAYTLVSVRTLRQAFEEVYWSARMNDVLLRNMKYSSLRQLQESFAQEQWARCSTAAGLYSSAVVVVPLENTTGNPDSVYQMVWWDPLTDADAIRRNNGSSRVWISARYLEEDWADPGCRTSDWAPDEYPTDKKRCVAAWTLDPHTGVPQRIAYHYSDKLINRLSDGEGGRWKEQQADWKASGAQWWREASVWYSEDGTPYAYVAYMTVLPAFPSHHPIFGNKKVSIPQYITFDGWQSQLTAKDMELEDTTVVAGLFDEGLDSQVLATNEGTSLMRTGCAETRSSVYDKKHPCIVIFRELRPTIQDAARLLTAVEENIFLREDISGGYHWLRRRLIHRAKAGDALPDIHLFWLRPVSSVQDKTDRGLYFFIGFLAVVCLVQGFLLAVEWWKVVLPLGKVSSAMGLMDDLRLHEAESRLEGVTDGCMVVSEVYSIVDSFCTAIQALHLYRGFLPQNLLPEEEDEEEFIANLTPAPPGDSKVCLVFTDIQSSTKLWEEVPQSMHDALMLHNQVLRKVAAVNNGYEVKVIGDAFMLAFTSPKDGLAFALCAQQALLEADWPPELLYHDLCRRRCASDGRPLWGGLRVRIGINYGQIYAQENPVTYRHDYFGPPVNVAARVEAAITHGGLVGATRAVLDAVGTDGMRELGNPVVVSMGDLSLKGVKDVTTVDIVFPAALGERRERIGKAKEDYSMAAKQSRQKSVTSSESATSPTADRGQHQWRKRSAGSAVAESKRQSANPQDKGGIKQSNPLLLHVRPSAAESGSEDRSADASTRGSFSSHHSMGRRGSPSGGPGAGHRLALRLTHNTCTAVCVHCSFVNNIHAPDQRMPGVLAAVEHNADVSRGAVMVVLSSAVVVGWNTSVPCGPHLVQAGVFLTAVVRKRGKTDLHLGSCTGGALVGNLSAGKRRHSVVLGGCVELAVLLAAEAVQGGDSALIDQDMADQLGAASVCKAQLWGYTEHPGERDHIIWEHLPGEGGDMLDNWGADEVEDGSSGLDAHIPPELFVSAASGNAAALAELKEMAQKEAAAGDARVVAMLARAEAGTLCRRRAPRTAFIFGI
eukprot:TRINITY_DN137_c0_g2_i1.p1 TRINITY_DN137_c0_g2~~TRINITY_DN137_c0_g2_i1.p1  ORF type:complete len:1126 (+),score=274.68 TRINITY_DN137_c0_g2_i1:109-3486(+)